MDSGLDGKSVIVTGASGGIGQEVARQFTTEGARVAVHYFRGQDRAAELVDSLPSENCFAVGADLTREDQVAAMFDKAESTFGHVDVLVANAGYWPPDPVPLHQMSLDQWESTIAVDLTSVFLCVREFVRRVEKHQIDSPSIVMIGSTAGYFGEAGHADYATAKSGLMGGLLATLKNELPRVSIGGRINAVCPGWTMTPMARKFADNESAMTTAMQTIALRKFGNPRDIAAAIVFLASPRLSRHISGQQLFVDGGMEGRVLYRKDEIDLQRDLGRTD